MLLSGFSSTLVLGRFKFDLFSFLWEFGSDLLGHNLGKEAAVFVNFHEWRFVSYLVPSSWFSTFSTEWRGGWETMGSLQLTGRTCLILAVPRAGFRTLPQGVLSHFVVPGNAENTYISSKNMMFSLSPHMWHLLLASICPSLTTSTCGSAFASVRKEIILSGNS